MILCLWIKCARRRNNCDIFCKNSHPISTLRRCRIFKQCFSADDLMKFIWQVGRRWCFEVTGRCYDWMTWRLSESNLQIQVDSSKPNVTMDMVRYKSCKASYIRMYPCFVLFWIGGGWEVKLGWTESTCSFILWSFSSLKTDSASYRF